jgi:tetratricopeptide (TPR) repeat protein
MAELAATDLIAAESADTFRFAHALIQDVAYESLLYSRRRKLHERAGSYFEVRYWQDPAPIYETLVYHYVRAGNRPRALLYSVLAGDKARNVFANDEAIEHYERAATLAHETGSTRVDAHQPVDVSGGSVHTNLADVLELTGAHSDAVRHYGRALALLGGPGLARVSLAPHRPAPEGLALKARQRPSATRKAIANICRKVGSVHERLSDYDTALDWFRAGIAVLPRGSSLERARGCIGIAGAYFRAGEYAPARTWAIKGLRLARENGRNSELAHAEDLLGVIYRDGGSASRAITHRKRALELYRELEDLGGQGDTLNNLGLDQFSLGDWDAAARSFEECLAIAGRTGDLDLQAIARNNLGEVYLVQGDLLRAKNEFRWTIDARQRLGHVAIGALAEANLGQALMLEGHLPGARQSLESSRAAFKKIKARAFEADVEVRMAALLFEEGRPGEARALARKALRSAETLDLLPVEESANLLLGRIAIAQQRWGAAQAHILAALRLAQRAGVKHGEARARAALGTMRLARSSEESERKAAASDFRRALSLFTSLGAALDAERVSAELQRLH